MGKKRLSKCCNARVAIRGSASGKISKYDFEFLCTECNSSCDLAEEKMITKNIVLEIALMIEKEMIRTDGESLGSDCEHRGRGALQTDFENDEIKGRVIVQVERKEEKK